MKGTLRRMSKFANATISNAGKPNKNISDAVSIDGGLDDFTSTSNILASKSMRCTNSLEDILTESIMSGSDSLFKKIKKVRRGSSSKLPNLFRSNRSHKSSRGDGSDFAGSVDNLDCVKKNNRKSHSGSLSSADDGAEKGKSTFFNLALEAELINKALTNGTATEVGDALNRTLGLIHDFTFAGEFIKTCSHERIIEFITQRGYEASEIESLLLCVFSRLIDYTFTADHPSDNQLISCTLITNDFISSIISYLGEGHYSDPNGLIASLYILATFVLNCPDRADCLLFTLDVALFNHLQKSCSGNLASKKIVDIQKKILTLIGALLDHTFSTRPDMLPKVIDRYLGYDKLKILVDCIDVLQEVNTKSETSDELVRLLTHLQFYILYPYLDAANSQPDCSNGQIEEMETLCALFENGLSINKLEANKIQAYKMIGFEDPHNPFNDFMDKPPGILAFNCLYYSAFHHELKIQQILNPSSGGGTKPEHKFPLVAAAKVLTMTLITVFGIGEDLSNNLDIFCPLLFLAPRNKPFEEIFVSCLVVFSRSWYLMKAIRSDLDSVEKVVREQIMLALQVRPYQMNTLDQRLADHTPEDIKNSWRNTQKTHEETKLQSQALRELQQRLKDSIVNLIERRRLKAMEVGEDFYQYKEKTKNKDKQSTHLNLSSNHKMMTMGDVTFQVSHITKCEFGSSAAHKKCPPKYSSLSYCVEISDPDKTESDFLWFSTKQHNVFYTWCDGFDILRGKQMTSSLFNQELKTLMDLEMKIRLLDIDSSQIPVGAPEIPAFPDNYDFATVDTDCR